MFQISEECEQLIVAMGVLFTFALLIVTRRVFNRATPLAGFEEVVDGRHASYARTTGKRREGVSAGPPHHHRYSEDQTPTYQCGKSILCAEQPSVLRDVAIARPRNSYVDDALRPRAPEELWHDKFEDEQGSASRKSADQLARRKGDTSLHHRRAHSLLEDDIPPASGPRHSTPAASVSRVSSSRTTSRTASRTMSQSSLASDSAPRASRAVSRSRLGTPASDPAQEDDWEGIPTGRFSTAHHALPALREDEVVENIYDDTFPASAPLPPKIPSRRRSATPEVRPPPVSSRSSRTGTEVLSASRAPTPALSVNTVSTQSQTASSAAQAKFLPSRAVSVAPSASRAPSIGPSASASHAPSMTPSMTRSQPIAPTTSISRSSLSACRSEVLPPRSGSSAGRSNSRDAAAMSRQATPSGAWTPTELVAKYPRQVYRRLQNRTKTGSRRSVGSEDTADNEDDNQSAGYTVTAWFESKSDTLLQCPTDLRLHPELQLGDIYYHTTGSRYQLWCWTLNNQGKAFWDEACWGYERNGLFLTLTGSLQRPSWVNKRRLATREREIGMQNDAVQIKKEADD